MAPYGTQLGTKSNTFARTWFGDMLRDKYRRISNLIGNALLMQREAAVN
jgi:hypothetical protein